MASDAHELIFEALARTQRFDCTVAFDGDARDMRAEVGDAQIPPARRARLVEAEHQRCEWLALRSLHWFRMTRQDAMRQTQIAPFRGPAVIVCDVLTGHWL